MFYDNFYLLIFILPYNEIRLCPNLAFSETGLRPSFQFSSFNFHLSTVRLRYWPLSVFICAIKSTLHSITFNPQPPKGDF